MNFSYVLIFILKEKEEWSIFPPFVYPWFSEFDCSLKLEGRKNIFSKDVTVTSHFSKVPIRSLHFYVRFTLAFVFINLKKHEEGFWSYEKREKAKIAFHVCFALSCYWGSVHPEQGEWPHQTPSLRSTLITSASNHCCFGLCPWASVLYLRLFCASLSKMCPKVSGKPKRGYFWDLGTLTKFVHINQL